MGTGVQDCLLIRYSGGQGWGAGSEGGSRRPAGGGAPPVKVQNAHLHPEHHTIFGGQQESRSHVGFDTSKVTCCGGLGIWVVASSYQMHVSTAEHLK